MKLLSKMSLRSKLLLLVIVPVLLSTSIAIVVASLQINTDGQNALEDKSTAILSRMEAVRGYVAGQNFLETYSQGVIEKHPDGQITNNEKEKLRNLVPIIASWRVGEKNAEADHYSFRIASLNYRDPKNQATEKEAEFLNQFQKGGAQTLTYVDSETNTFWVMRPVYLKASEGCLRCHGDPSNSPFDNKKDILGYPMENLKDGDMRGMFMIISDLKPVQQRVNQAILTIALWGLLISAAAIFIGLVVVRKILQAIRQMMEVSRRVADGNLTQQLDIKTDDELGRLGQNINEMVSSLNRVLHDVLQSAAQLAHATREISSSSDQISKGAQDQAVQFEQLSSSVQNTSQNAEQADVIIRQAVLQADSAEKGMSNAISAMRNIDDNSKRIAEAVTLITDIAFQTNLLALNAAVEAARAGQHGRGFAVVAAEVRKLSEKSNDSAKDIENTINTSLVSIEQGVSISNQAGQQIREIIEGINKTANALNEITAAAKEQAATMEHNTAITTANATASEQLAASANTLADQANRLNDLVSKFRLS